MLVMSQGQASRTHGIQKELGEQPELQDFVVVLIDHWRDVTALNAHAPAENRSYKKDSLHEEL
jgi:hypothetical protein